MLLEPTLIVRELVVLRGGHQAYRAQFHAGINIIAGENSSGKSTLLNLLVYGLGADVTH
jgi:predicted ATPase